MQIIYRVNRRPVLFVMVIALPRIGKRTFVPASSAPSERAFSSADLTVTKLRHRLTGEHVEAIIFLYMNEDVLQVGLSDSVSCAFFKYTC